MTFRFHDIVRLASVAFAGFALLAAGEAPQPRTPGLFPAIATDVSDAAAVDAAPVVRGDLSVAADSDETSVPAVDLNRPASLRSLVAQVQALPATPLNAAGKCLARAVFFEARGEPLEGQLAVAQVILNRVASGRYADDVCGVINQPGQFTFARRAVDTRSADWQTAAAIAVIAQAQRWLQIAPRAMAFHAARVNVSWGGMQRVSRIGNHVFYR